MRREVLEGLPRERLGQKDDDDRLNHQQHPTQQASRCYGPALGQQGDEGEIDGQQEHGREQQHALAGRRPAVQQDVLRQRQQRDRENQARAVEAPAEQQGRGEHGKREDGREARGRTAQRRKIEQQRRGDENRDIGNEKREDAFHRASNGTCRGRKVNCVKITG